MNIFARIATQGARGARSFSTSQSFDVVIVGGGAAGLATASKLRLKDNTLNIAVVEPSEKHYYQPGWTMVGGGIFEPEETVKPTMSLIPEDVAWIKSSADKFLPEENKVIASDGTTLDYKYLVVAAGFKCNWDAVPGMAEALEDGDSRVVSNYKYEYAPKTFKEIWKFQGGEAIFSQPPMPIKCAGAPQKIMYLADEYWTKEGFKNDTNVTFYTATPGIFSQPDYAKELNKICDERELTRKFNHNLIGIEQYKREATFKNLTNEEEVTVPYDFLHVVPPQGPHDFLKNSPIVNEAGFVDVDKETLQHTKYKNIFSLGDASSIPTSKTAAAICGQYPTLVQNLLSHKNGEEMTAKYWGYTACPLTTGYNKLLMAEFDYDLKATPCLPSVFNQMKPGSFPYLLKKHVFPNMYWNGILKGTWEGPSQLPFTKKYHNKKA